MRIKLTLLPVQHTTKIPFNYQYYITSWFYGVIKRVDEKYGVKLHDTGFEYSKAVRFRGFTFSPFNFPFQFQYKKGDSYFRILREEFSITFAIKIDKTYGLFIKSILEENNIFDLFNKNFESSFDIVRFEILTEQTEFTSEMSFRAISPIVVDCYLKNINGKRENTYILPSHERYNDLILRNLNLKLQVFESINLETETIEIIPITEPRSKLIAIKKGETGATNVRGYLYDFIAKADPLLLKVGYELGFGSLNAHGFGFVDLL